MRLLVYGLVPVQAHVGAEEVWGDPGEGWLRAHAPEDLRARDEVGRDRLRVEPRDPEAPVGEPGQELAGSRVAGCDRLVDRAELRGGKRVFEHETSDLVVLTRLRGGDRRERPVVIVPREPRVPRVWLAG